MTNLIEAIGRAIAAADKGDYLNDRELYDEDRQRYDARARGALTAIDAAGFAVVPKEPTEGMVAAVRDPRTANGSPISKGFHDTWRAALAAASKVEA